MVGEGALALGSILVVTAGIAATQADWAAHYASWTAASGGAAGFFVTGVAQMAENLGVPAAVGQVFAAVIVVSFAATTMDTGVRLQRYIIGEIGDQYGIKILGEPTVATTLAVGTCLLLAFGASAPGGGVGSGGLVIWPLFGTTNQLLAALSLIVISVYLRRLGRPIKATLLPMIFLLIMTVWAMLTSLGGWLFGPKPNYLMGIMGVIVLFSALWMALEAYLALRRPPVAIAEEAGKR